MSTTIANLTHLKKDFPMLKKTMHGKPFIYLDSAATAHKPQIVIDTVSKFYQDQYATVLRGTYEFAELANIQYQAAREKARRFLNATKVEEIIFTRGTTDGINTVAASYGKAFIRQGDYIFLTQMEHHSNIVPWQLMAEERGAKILYIPIDEFGNLQLDRYKEMLKEHRPKIVALTHISNVLGTVNPVKEIAALAHKHGAHILVDGAQSAPHIQIDVQDLNVDFYTFSGHKIYGPTGVGILYGKADLLNAIPPYQGGGAMIEHVTFEKTTFNVLPWKFEAGTMMLAEIMGLAAAIDYIENVGFQAIQAWESGLIEFALEKLSQIDGLHIVGKPYQRESVISFTLDGIHPLDLGTMLDLNGIAIRTGHHCAQPLLNLLKLNSVARISVGIYNSQEDINAFIETLKSSIKALR